MKEPVRLFAVGDLLLGGRYDDIARAGHAAEVFAALRPLLERADIVAGNLECALCDRGDPRPGKLCVRADPAYADVLAGAGFNVVSLANNHSFDYGAEGFADARERLESAGVRTVGAGENAAAAAQAVILQRRGLRIGFLAFCHGSTRPSDLAAGDRPGVAELEAAAVIGAVQHWRAQVDQLVLLLHWGLEYSPLPTPEQVGLARRAIDAGAGAVIGHHSHMVQGVERHGAGVVAYSLGNCTDADVDWHGPDRHYRARMTESDRQGLGLLLELSAERVRVTQLCPLWLNDRGQPEPATGARAQAILDSIAERSAALCATDLGRRWEADLVNRRVLGPLRHWWSRGSLLDKVRGFRLSQVKTLLLLLSTYARIRWSRSEQRWSLFNPRNDERPMPYAGKDDENRE